MKKKYYFVILFLVLAIFLSGCSGGEGTPPPIVSNQLPTASFTSDSLVVGVTADIGTGPADSGWQMIKTVYAMFMGALVLLTILSFVSGRP